MSERGSEIAFDDGVRTAWVPQLSQLQLRDQVYGIIRTRILHRDFPPGARLDLEQLESAMGISRTPLKEALQRLASEGLIEVVARRGTYVSQLDTTAAADLFDLRQLIEEGAVPRLLANAGDDEIEAVVALNDGLIELLDSGPYADVVVEFIERDREFHAALMGLTGNRALVDVHRGVNTHLQIARVNTSFVRSQSDLTLSEHQRIVDSLRSRDEAALHLAIGDHIRTSRDRTLVAMGNEP